jgi:hypothetical protein
MLDRYIKPPYRQIYLEKEMKVSFKSKMVFTFTTIGGIFVADLLITILNKYIMTLDKFLDPHLVTIIGMIVVLALFYILVSNIEKISNWGVRTFVKIGRRYLGRSLGLYAILIVLAFAIFSGYYWAWFDRIFPLEIRDWAIKLFKTAVLTF